jgi:hypothetical protein
MMPGKIQRVPTFDVERNPADCGVDAVFSGLAKLQIQVPAGMHIKLKCITYIWAVVIFLRINAC